MATQSVGLNGSAEIGSARDDLHRPWDTFGWAGARVRPLLHELQIGRKPAIPEQAESRRNVRTARNRSHSVRCQGHSNPVCASTLRLDWIRAGRRRSILDDFRGRSRQVEPPR